MRLQILIARLQPDGKAMDSRESSRRGAKAPKQNIDEKSNAGDPGKKFGNPNILAPLAGKPAGRISPQKSQLPARTMRPPTPCEIRDLQKRSRSRGFCMIF